MKKNESGRTHYRLAARLRDNRLELDPSVGDELTKTFYRSVREIRRHVVRPDRAAFLESVEWERLGDFLAAAGSKIEAIRAYREAVVSCLCGTEYDHGRESYPCRLLRLRFYETLERGLACCGDDRRLRSMLTGDPTIREAYRRMEPVRP